jgi:immune inhibitor A
MGAWEKLQLGWLDYQQVNYGYDRDVKIGPADQDSKTLPQALLVSLPNKTVTTEYNTPHSGDGEWWGGSADDLNSTLTRSIDLTGKSSASLSAWLQYNIEEDYDALYAEVSTDGGSTWNQVGDLIDGPTGNDGLSDWAEQTWDLSAYAGQSIQFRFRYQTDGGLHFEGPFIDDITVTADGETLLSDNVDGGDNGWTAAGGFLRFNGTTKKVVDHYYLAENRVYTRYDKVLQTGPYNFGWANTKPDWVERFPYQNGLLVWYVDNEYDDNNTSVHPGHGQVLPVDARYLPIKFPNGTLLGNRRQPFDATFGQEKTDAYFDASNPLGGVYVAGHGVTVTVTSQNTGGTMGVTVNNPAE